MNPALGDEVAENTLEAIAQFNYDMKMLALNAYQMQDLLENTIKENQVMHQWLEHLENKTINTETKLYKAINFAMEKVQAKRMDVMEKDGEGTFNVGLN